MFQWQWAAPSQAKIMFQVFQTIEDSDDPLEGGFQSPRSPSGSFRHTFYQRGNYYFSSGAVDSDGAIVMRGKVTVQDQSTSTEEIKITVAGKKERMQCWETCQGPFSIDDRGWGRRENGWVNEIFDLLEKTYDLVESNQCFGVYINPKMFQYNKTTSI